MKDERSTVMKLVATAATFALAGLLLRGVLPELYRYMRIRRM